MNLIQKTDYKRPHAMKAASPFRYPGGKGFLTEFFQQKLASISPKIVTYVEPFAGGAGAALNLLHRGAVERIILNDIDIRIYSAWRAILTENERFLEELKGVSVDMRSWHRYREIVNSPPSEYSFELGFATFFINRTSRAGIILGSGPIGGYSQDGNWTIDVRFYRETLLRRCKWIGQNSSRIDLFQEPATAFLRRLSSLLPNKNTFYFIDPPYVAAGTRLYHNGMMESDHRDLAELLQAGSIRNWVLTYDNDPLIHEIYAKSCPQLLEVGYSLRRTRSESELLISSV